MNYIAEIKAFYDWLEINPLPPPAIVLWYALMHIANKTGWQQEFTVAVSVLQNKTGLNAKAIERARNSLCQSGRINWKSRKGSQSAIYSMISLCDKIAHESVAQSVAESVAQPVVKPVSQSVAINKHKLNETNNKKNNKEKFAVYFPDDEQLNKTFLDFIEMRENLKNGAMTDEAVKRMVKKIIKLNRDEALKLLDQSIINNWKDIYPLKDDGNKKSKESSKSNQFKQFPQREMDLDALVMQDYCG